METKCPVLNRRKRQLTYKRMQHLIQIAFYPLSPSEIKLKLRKYQTQSRYSVGVALKRQPKQVVHL